MQTKLVVIGNSQGVRLPRSVVAEAGVELDQPLKVEVRRGSIVLSPVSGARQGWAAAAREAGREGAPLWSGLAPATGADDDWTW